jgi:mannose-6-phosphate isomerase-like protein (cupin superfamily)
LDLKRRPSELLHHGPCPAPSRLAPCDLRDKPAPAKTGELLMIVLRPVASLLMFAAASGAAEAKDRGISVMNLDTIVAEHPVPAGSASVVASFEAGKGELQVVVASKIPLHIHDQDHVVFVASGTGAARIENAAGGIDTRPVKPGDIIDIPHGKKHGFEKAGQENLVLLVTTTPSKHPPKFFE